MLSWTDVETYLLEAARADLGGGLAIAPCLVAFRGDEPLLSAFLRPFDKGGYHDPMIELLALAGGLEADRLAVSFPGRAWSLVDPIPPVLADDADLRQQVVVITFVDATVEPPSCTSSIVPYEPAGASPLWGPALRTDAGQGWIPQAMTVAAQHRAELATGWPEVRAQAARCQRLGHVLGFAPATARKLRREPGRAAPAP